MLIDGLESCRLFVDYCDVVHSDGTHSLMSKWCNVEFLQINSDEETNSSTSWIAWVSTFHTSINARVL